MRKKLTIIWLLLVIWILIVGFFILKKNNQGIINVSVISSTEEDNNGNKGENKWLEDEDEIKTKDKDKERLENNAKILAQIQDDDFWNKKIEEIINKKLWGERWEIEILWYWLLCEQWKEYQQDLSQCEYTVWFLNKVGDGHFGYDSYCDWYSSNYLNYCSIAVAMNDIWNWGIFYNDRYSTGTNLKVNNGDWTATYYLYKIDSDSWEILDKSSENIINRNTAREIIANHAWVNKDVVDPILRIWEWIYECDFSYKWHTYEYVISTEDGTILKGWDEIDIWEEAAMEIATNDAWIKWEDLMLEVDHWHMFTYLMPHTEKIWTGDSAIYRVAITTNKDKYYLYDISAIDGKILSSKFGEKFVINNKNWNSKGLTFEFESVFPKKQKFDAKIHELKMDNIYEFKDLIYLWIEFEWNKIVDWSIIDKDSEKNMWKLSREELDELYNFESHHKIMKITDTKTINLSKLKENVIYKFSKKWNNWTSWSYPEVVNDLWLDVVVYENIDYEYTHVENWVSSNRPKIYRKSPIVYEKYPFSDVQNYYGHSTVDWSTYYIMYKKVDKSELLWTIGESGITFLSKYKVWDVINSRDRWSWWIYEEYLYNDTDDDVTVFITDEIAKERDWIKDMKITVKPWKFVFCSSFVDSITIVN